MNSHQDTIQKPVSSLPNPLAVHEQEPVLDVDNWDIDYENE